MANWSHQINSDRSAAQRTPREGFVDLDLEPGIQASREVRRQERKRRVSDLLLLVKGNILIVGDPGAGKTTSLRYIAYCILNAKKPSLERGPTILIEFRNLGSEERLSEAILDAVGISRVSLTDENSRLQAAIGILHELHAQLLLEGLDELNSRVRSKILQELDQILLRASQFRVFITCRAAEASTIRFGNCKAFAIEPLNELQVELFARKWLGDKAAQGLLKRVRDTPYRGVEVLPLTLAQLCSYYDKKKDIPPKPRSIYQTIVRSLLEEWDAQKNVHRKSMYANFDSDRKEEFLRALAYSLTLKPRVSRTSTKTLVDYDRQITFDDTQLMRAYRSICKSFGLPDDESQRVVREIESHTGLILKTGIDRYEFTHRSIQEYFVAQHIVRKASMPPNIATHIPGEMGLVVALSTDASDYFCLIVEDALKGHESSGTNGQKAAGRNTQPERSEIIKEFTYPFLRRIYLERVDFHPGAGLGQRITELYSATFLSEIVKFQMELPFDFSSRIFRDFTGLGGIKESFQLALNRASLEQNGGGTWRVHWKNTGNDSYKELLSEGAVIDISFMELFGTHPRS